MLLTGGDDGNVLGSKVLSAGSQTSHNLVSTHLYSHISSVKCLWQTPSLLDDATLLTLTGGGRAQLVAAKLNVGECSGSVLTALIKDAR